MVLTILLIFFGWSPLNEWLTQQLNDSSVAGAVDPVVGAAAALTLKAWLIPIAAAVILLPIAAIVGLAVAGIWVMPLVLAHVGQRDYPHVQARGRHATVLSVWNAIWVSVAFVVGWVITLPLWLVPPLGLIASVLLWSFAFSRMMRVDALVDYADPMERRTIWRERNVGFWLIGLGCALINLFPPAWIFLPVFAGLVFAHYSFDSLERLREQQSYYS
jgi:hypothetical protein